MKNTRTVTPFMKASDRLMDAFAAEMEALGLKADTRSMGGHYCKDGVFLMAFETLPEPVKGNKAKMEALRAAGYVVDVYAPYDWNRRRAFVVRVGRRVEITAADQAAAERENCVAFRVDTSIIKDGQVVSGFFVRGQRATDLNWPLLAEVESLEAAKAYIRGIRINPDCQPVYGPDGYGMAV